MKDIAALLKQFGIRPKKSLGQNFLTDEAALRRIVEAGSIRSEDTVLEIGPGVGNLTRHLALAARRVVAVELDDRLIPLLRHTLAEFRNIELIHGDILQLPPSHLQLPPSYKVIANIPYYITAPILRRLLESDPRPSLLVLTVQQEVAERVCAKPDGMSLLAVSVQFYGEPEIVARLPAGAFHPPPDVDSAVVRIVSHETPPVAVANADRFFGVVKAGFSQRRKQLKNALAAGMGMKVKDVETALKGTGIDPTRRAETLSLAEWVRIETALSRLISSAEASRGA